MLGDGGPYGRAVRGALTCSVARVMQFPKSMTAINSLQEIWHDHAGARWLIPMIAALAVTILGLAYMLMWPYVST